MKEFLQEINYETNQILYHLKDIHILMGSYEEGPP